MDKQSGLVGGVLDSALIKIYLEGLAVKNLSVLTSDLSYLDHPVSKTDALFVRSVARYTSRAQEPEPNASSDVLDTALLRYGKLALIGEVGLGKTTSLWNIAKTAAVRSLSLIASAGWNDISIPVCACLKYYNGEPDLETLLARSMNEILRPRQLAANPVESARVFRTWLSQSGKNFLLLLDGLDEVPSEFHAPVRQALHALLDLPCRLIVTGRNSDYDESLRVPTFIMQGLQEREIKDYLRQRLGGKGGKLFDARIGWNTEMRSLAANPLLLWLFTVVAQNELEAQLPETRGKLVQRFVAQMRRVRADEKGNAQATDTVTLTLAKLAFEMQVRHRTAATLADVSRWNISHDRSLAEKALAAGRKWRFLLPDGRADGSVEFLHPLFQEYFAAVHLDAEIKVQGFQVMLGEYAFLGGLDEVMVLLAGIHERAVDLIQWLGAQTVKRNQGETAFLVQQCWEASTASGDARARNAVVDALMVALRDRRAGLRLHAADALEKIPDPRAAEALVAALHDEHEGVRQHATNTLGKISDARTVDLLIATLRDPENDVRWCAVHALGKIGDSRALAELQRVAREDKGATSWGVSVADAARQAAEKIWQRPTQPSRF